MRRGVLALLLVFVSLGFVPSARAQSITIPPSQESSSASHVNAQVRKIVVDSDSGDVTIKPGSGATVKHTDHWVYAKPSVTTKLSGGVLTVTSHCPNNAPLNNCWTEITASVTRTALVQAESALGFIHVAGIRTSSVSAVTSNGNVVVSGVEAKTVSAKTSNGDVKVSLSAAPDDTRLRTSNGNVTAVVPKGRYALELRAGYGDITVTGVKNSRRAAHKLAARTSNGDITISGR
jgi:hypothetical protein